MIESDRSFLTDDFCKFYFNLVHHEYNRKFYPELPTKLHDLRVLCEKLKKYVNPEMTAIDMGSGPGKLCVFLAKELNINVVGIDANSSLVTGSTKAVRILEDQGFLRKNQVKFYLGNYFPDNFTVSDQIKWLNWKEGPSLLKDVNPYADMGKTLSDFDIIVIYQFSVNADATMKLVSMNTKSDAYIVVIGGLQSILIPNFLKSVEHVSYLENTDVEAGFDIFRKQ